jgi:hypothetical protein
LPSKPTVRSARSSRPRPARRPHHAPHMPCMRRVRLLPIRPPCGWLALPGWQPNGRARPVTQGNGMEPNRSGSKRNVARNMLAAARAFRPLPGAFRGGGQCPCGRVALAVQAASPSITIISGLRLPPWWATEFWGTHVRTHARVASARSQRGFNKCRARARQVARSLQQLLLLVRLRNGKRGEALGFGFFCARAPRPFGCAVLACMYAWLPLPSRCPL